MKDFNQPLFASCRIAQLDLFNTIFIQSCPPMFYNFCSYVSFNLKIIVLLASHIKLILDAPLILL